MGVRGTAPTLLLLLQEILLLFVELLYELERGFGAYIKFTDLRSV